MTGNKDKKEKQEEVLGIKNTSVEDMTKEEKAALLEDLAGRLFDDELGDGSSEAYDKHYYQD